MGLKSPDPIDASFLYLEIHSVLHTELVRLYNYFTCFNLTLSLTE